MFSSEQIFTVNGCDNKMLEKVLNFALELSGWKGVEAFYKDKNGLVFCSCECSGSTTYPFEATVPVLVEQINQYIKNLSDEEVAKLAGPVPDIDGSVKLGWKIFYPLWYGENEIEKYEWSAILAVRPCWIVFAK